ncbi:putative glutamate receptor [Lucilia cuprina]|nr:putative glutamate receptor [Lucilia cuprina]
MRLIIFTVTLSLLVTWSCEQQQPEQEQQPQQQERQQQQQKHYNLSIMLNAIDSDMPLSLQNSISACSSIIHEYFVPITGSFMVSTHVQELHLKWHLKDFLNNVLLNLPMIKVEIESKSSSVRYLTMNRKYNLIVVDSIESLRQLDPAYYTRNYDIQEYYMVYLMHGSRFANLFSVLNQMFEYFWQNSIINVSLMTANKQFVVDVFTYFPFDNYLTCRMPWVEQINYYSGSWSQPIAMTIFPEKINNLENCPLDVAVWNTPPYLSYLKSDEGVYKIDYFEAVLLKVLSEKLNFSLNLQEPPNDEQRGKVLANGTITGAMKMLHDHSADLSLGSFRYTLERSTVLTAAVPYYQTHQIYAILTNMQLYTSLEILLYPFDKITWIILFLSLLFGLFIAFVIDHFYDKCLVIQVAIGYPALKTPTTDIFRFLMGQSLIQIPETIFARFMIIFWHIYGLLLRTAYQSLLFQLLKLNVYHEPPKTLTDLINQQCILVMTEEYFRTKFVFFVEYDKQDRCLAAVSSKDFLTYHIINEHKRGLFYILPEKIFAQHITMYFSKHSFLINRFNQLFMNLRGIGLVDFWAHQSLDTDYLQNKHKATFKSINLSDIEGILIIWSVLLLVAVVVFFLEVLYDHTADISLGSFRYTLERSTVLTAAVPYYQTFQIYGILTTTQLYTSLERLVYPFDNVTWIYLFFSVQLGLIIAFIIDYLYDKSLLVRIAIGNPRIRTPVTNVMRLFMGQSLIQIPETHFSRFMIISWHVYGLLLRTAYQSLLFQLLKLNIYHEPPENLSDLINQQCILVMTEGTYDTVHTVPRIEEGYINVIKLKNTSEESSFFFLENDKELRCLAVVSPKDFLTYHVIKERKMGIFYVLPETIFAQQITMYFSKHSFLINRFNALFMNLRSMGLIDFWARKSLNTDFLKSTRETQFIPINMENVEGILIIYSVLILIGIVVFFIEMIIFRVKLLTFGKQHEFVH